MSYETEKEIYRIRKLLEEILEKLSGEEKNEQRRG